MRFGKAGWTLLAVLACLHSVAFAQTATIAGTITGPDGGAVKEAVVQARNASSGALVRASASPQGEYKLDLPPGTYDIAVPMPCCQWGSFAQSNLVVRAGSRFA